MLSLNHINSPLSRAERLRLNENWVIITNGVNNIQSQLNSIAGGEVEQIIRDIENALATSTTNSEALIALLRDATVKMTEVQVAINNSNTTTNAANAAINAANTATSNANTAANEAVVKISEITNAINSVQTTLNNAINALSQFNTESADALTLVTNATNAANTATTNADNASNEATTAANAANEAANEANTANEAANTAAVNAANAANAANTATTNADTAANAANEAANAANEAVNEAVNAANEANMATINADNAANEAVNAAADANTSANTANAAADDAREMVDGLEGYNDSIKPFTLNTIFKKHNAARYNGSTYRAKVETTGNPLPVAPEVENEWWTLEAQRGVDGEGAVSSVNGILPNELGDVDLGDLATNWESIGDKPTTFPPSTHTHPIAEIDALQSTLNNINAAIANIGQTGISKLVSYQFVVPAVSDGQVDIIIPLDTFNTVTDTLLLFRNTTVQSPDTYSVDGLVITLAAPVETAANTVFHMMILKNVQIAPDENGIVNNLLSDRTDAVLSAAMGKFIKSLIDALANEKVDAAFVADELARLVGSVPSTLSTLEALSEALGDDPNFAVTIMDMLGEKASNTDLTSLQQTVTTHLDNTNESAHGIDNIIGLREALGNAGGNTPLANVKNLTVFVNLLRWVNPTSNDFLGVEVYMSTSDLSSWDRDFCVNSATKIADGNVTTATFSYVEQVQYYIKVFGKYDVFGNISFSEGIVATATINDLLLYDNGQEFYPFTKSYEDGTVTFVKNSNNLQLEAIYRSDKDSRIYVSTPLIDISNFRTLKIEGEILVSVQNDVINSSFLQAQNTNQHGTLPSDARKTINNNTTGTMTLDISNISGFYHISLASYVSNIVRANNVKGSSKVKIFKVWLEV